MIFCQMFWTLIYFRFIPLRKKKVNLFWIKDISMILVVLQDQLIIKLKFIKRQTHSVFCRYIWIQWVFIYYVRHTFHHEAMVTHYFNMLCGLTLKHVLSYFLLAPIYTLQILWYIFRFFVWACPIFCRLCQR